MVAQPIPERTAIDSRLARSFQSRQIGPGDSVLDLFPVPRAVIDARYRQGAMCLAVFQKDQLAGYIWLCADKYIEDEVNCIFEIEPTIGVFDFDLYVFPAFRSSFAFAALWSVANDLLRQRGVLHTFSRVAWSNVQSLRSHRHLGATVISSAVFVRLFGREFMISDTRPYFATANVGDRRLIIRLRAPR
jgi:hypothetical protein